MDIEKLLPLSEASYYLLLALDEPAHGYAVMQQVEQASGGRVRIGPGTLYGAFATLEKQGLIEKAGEEERRKYFRTTPLGRAVAAAQLDRLEAMVQHGRAVLNVDGKGNGA
ncbi:DNA-binding PadR family transcriptional regulator [Pseudoduganella flava]|uniref:PadR family transcriptional regulator n=1 Tax=Pseudoduganella flava TaxID=871742 RepID=A0A562PGS8_9BURK|nr:PadR family transcriptional regulator [Pseudoduganella flava]QGZ40267.1 PadR family transcriptional regulator [Pseudoduganella flava]TWI43450.1 DNA-binding PadR family transcriptional regulator [Pseudoduganella flava]